MSDEAPALPNAAAPNRPEDGNKEFLISITLAGAVSAGAYSAGVLDFLILALEEWEKERKPDDHRVAIVGMSGASAGAIVGALGLVGMAGLPGGKKPDFPENCQLPELYQAWVVDPDLTTSPTVGALLNAEPLKDPKTAGLVSLLDAEPLDRIARRAIREIAARRAQDGGLPPPRPYLAADFHLFMTHSNLRGVPYEVQFAGQPPSSYGMTCHADRAHYRITGVGSHPYVSVWASRDSLPKRLDIPTALATAPEGAPWAEYIQDALASGAFPLGLAARGVANEVGAYTNRVWPLELSLPLMQAAVPAWPKPWNACHPRPDTPAPYASWDGGMFNNEPFEYARYCLRPLKPNGKGELDANPREADKVDRAVLMIDPFPDRPDFNPDDTQGADITLTKVLARALPTFIQQGRFKLDELILALDQDTASRWLIVPRRPANPAAGPAPDDLACGLLQGFGGFIDRSFRDYDYALGRRNCQDFLAKWFGVAPGNPKVSDRALLPQAPSSANPGTPPASPKKAVIPLRGRAAKPLSVPPWPQIDAAKLAKLVDAAAIRLEAVVAVLIARQTSWKRRQVLSLLWWWFKDRSRAIIQTTVLAELIRRNQFAFTPTNVELFEADRLVLAEVIQPDWDFVSRQAIQRALGLAESALSASLKELMKHDLLVCDRDNPDAADAAFTWWENRPSRLSGVPLLGPIQNAIAPPKIKP
jgi:hypothetical protein